MCVLVFFRYGCRCIKLSGISFTVDIDDVQIARALLHIIREVVHRANDDQMAFFHFICKQFHALGNLVIDVQFHTVDVAGHFADGFQFFLNRLFQLSFGIAAECC